MCVLGTARVGVSDSCNIFPSTITIQSIIILGYRHHSLSASRTNTTKDQESDVDNVVDDSLISD